MFFVHHVHAARDDRSGHCARICDSRASTSGGTMAGTAGFADVCVRAPFTVKSWSTSCERAACHAPGCRSSFGCACAHFAKVASMAFSASMKR